VYQDFDQVMERLMIPGRTEESALQISEWSGQLDVREGRALLGHEKGGRNLDVGQLAASLITRGITLIALTDERGKAVPLYKLAGHAPFTTTSVLALAIHPRDVHGEMTYLFEQKDDIPLPGAAEQGPCDLNDILQLRKNSNILKLVITGWIVALPLLLKMLLRDYDRIEVRIIDDITRDEHIDRLVYLQRRIGEMDGALERISLDLIRWNFTDMNRLREFTQDADRIILSQPQHLKTKAYLAITTVLAHLITVIREMESHAQIFPILQNREQARLLQEELDQFELPTEVHVTVPDEFYGTYIAHTSYYMYASESDEAYELQRTLRHTIDTLMADVGEDDDMDIQTMQISGELPEDAEALFATLLDAGYIWIGYRLHRGFVWHDPLQDNIRKFFPREQDFSCLRQHQIIINPFGNPVSRHSWLEWHKDIAELIVICAEKEVLTDMEQIAREAGNFFRPQAKPLA
ncbi:MAG: hypothetical protein Q9M30_08925, partial [Mariprofundaceae bacterium]|nr:hypothetical protein [Mariprofundaceae bacterium]